jgi:hypothetical protein
MDLVLNVAGPLLFSPGCRPFTPVRGYRHGHWESKLISGYAKTHNQLRVFGY